jgi:hypothetical protein
MRRFIPQATVSIPLLYSRFPVNQFPEERIEKRRTQPEKWKAWRYQKRELNFSTVGRGDVNFHTYKETTCPKLLHS